jgi:hypothetical protein
VRTFTCELCRRTLETEVPIEDVAAEAVGLFGPLPADRDQVVSLCDPCYGLVMDWAVEQGLPWRWEP